MSSKRGSYQVEVDANDEEEAISVASEGVPRGAALKDAQARQLSPGTYEVTITFGPPKAS